MRRPLANALPNLPFCMIIFLPPRRYLPIPEATSKSRVSKCSMFCLQVSSPNAFGKIKLQLAKVSFNTASDELLGAHYLGFGKDKASLVHQLSSDRGCGQGHVSNDRALAACLCFEQVVHVFSVLDTRKCRVCLVTTCPQIAHDEADRPPTPSQDRVIHCNRRATLQCFGICLGDRYCSIKINVKLM